MAGGSDGTFWGPPGRTRPKVPLADRERRARSPLAGARRARRRDRNGSDDGRRAGVVASQRDRVLRLPAPPAPVTPDESRTAIGSGGRRSAPLAPRARERAGGPGGGRSGKPGRAPVPRPSVRAQLARRLVAMRALPSASRAPIASCVVPNFLFRQRSRARSSAVWRSWCTLPPAA
jgi:hypothetical protein